MDLVHELGIVLLDAWGSADGITEHEYRPSYTFRLSLRDRYAMPALLRHAQKKGAKQVGIMVPNTGWGRSNAKAAQRYQERESAPKILKPVWYNWGEKNMLRHYRVLLSAGVDAVILVANDIEGSRLVHQLAAIDGDEMLPIISHWGVTGGKMVEKSGAMLHKLDFSVVQTFSLFTADPQIRNRVMSRARRLLDIQGIEDVESPVGFGHAYDLIHILARAVNIAGTTNRAKVRDALEQVRDYRGLTGSYARPFSPESHDALKQEQVFMARYREDGVIVPLSLGRK
ncbi:MAG: ABC transporter substrate-binding protein [endosymbiont of Seepiophila jonesi]|uniref:ABC transporter substrate-binding protein n=1 Tax=endosymbiont of Lamellibrachia luymesi TaxID=2200907 RepID=A0A370DAA6_9GAMM|nr:MAG: ABC transporter substrate-binding protein [endosymbiont of Lamellibrachia luymesi]RDH92092.1 MAG: ABC transporter substrate-binding protein [endosymbiont of Seepiophila jonesi]